MHSVVIRKVLIRNGTSKVSSSILSHEDLAASLVSGRQLVTYAKVAMHVNGVYMEKNGNELVRKAWWGLPTLMQNAKRCKLPAANLFL